MKREKNDFVLEYDYENNIINKKEIDLKNLPFFDITTVININKNKNIFTDVNENIFVVEKNNFRISIINSEDS